MKQPETRIAADVAGHSVNGGGAAIRRRRPKQAKSATTIKHAAAKQAHDLSIAVLFSCLLYGMIWVGVSAWRQGLFFQWHDPLQVVEICGLIVIFLITTVPILKWLAVRASVYVVSNASEIDHRLRVMKYVLFCVFIIVVSVLSALLGISANQMVINERPATFWFAIPPSLTVGALPRLQGEDGKKGRKEAWKTIFVCLILSICVYLIVSGVIFCFYAPDVRSAVALVGVVFGRNDVVFLYIVAAVSGYSTEINSGILGFVKILLEVIDGIHKMMGRLIKKAERLLRLGK